jgi:hypothetical protein
MGMTWVSDTQSTGRYPLSLIFPLTSRSDPFPNRNREHSLMFLLSDIG